MYAPRTVFTLNEELARMRGEMQAEVTRLVETGSLDTERSEHILERSKRNLRLMQWSEYEQHLTSTPAGGGAQPPAGLNPAVELMNAH